MRSLIKNVVVLVIITVVIVQAEAKGCTVDPSVKDQKEREAQQRLLSTLDPLQGKRSVQTQDKEGHKFDFVVCDDVNGLTNVGVVEQLTVDGHATQVTLGMNNQSLVSSQSNWLMLTLLGGGNCTVGEKKMQKQAHIMFICDPYQTEVEIHHVEDLGKPVTNCSFLFTVRNKIVCAPPPAEGLSGGAIFFILVFVTFGAYFTFGFFYLRLVKGAKGVEQIPNRLFWFKIGNALADGCGAVFRCDQYCGGGGVTASSSYDGYSPIEERMAQDLQDSDRDSALLSP